MILGTRGSRLALAQADLAAAAIRRAAPDESTITMVVATTGDLVHDRPLKALGGYGAFVKELDAKIIAGEIDASVNSLKDMPVDPTAGVELCAVLPRAAEEDVLVGATSLASLPPGAKVGTSSVRRRAQLLNVRPDLEAVDLRGNVTTRLTKLERGDYDAIILARAGLDRLGERPRMCALDPAIFIPSPGQGAVALCAAAGGPTSAVLKKADHAPTRSCVDAERLVLKRMGGGCSVPIGVRASISNDRMHIAAVVLSEDGSRSFRMEEDLPLGAGETLERFAECMAKGGDSL
jgi:hydroxymethylbilane synthase